LNGDRLSVDINERLMARAVETSRRALESHFEMPGHWRFSRYSLAEFREAYAIPFALAAIQFFARRKAVKVRGPASGVSHSLSIVTQRSLRRLVSRHSDAPAPTAAAVLEDLTYGARGMGRPDPALQPLVVLRNDTVAIMPQLWLHRSAERNLLTLLNRIPAERSIYLRLVDEKEDLMRNALVEKAIGLHLRTWHGQVPNCSGLPDIDLALVDDQRKVCVILELKWFIGPADTREVINKSEEIRKGVKQARSLLTAWALPSAPLHAALKTNSSYSVLCALVSATSIGSIDVQDPAIPIVNLPHLLRQLGRSRELPATVEWLRARRYLPVEGRDYRVVEFLSTVGDWSVRWYGIQAMIDGAADL
jgi:hypothetical protein